MYSRGPREHRDERRDSSPETSSGSARKRCQLLAERQKLIKIADRSENGWGVVAEYTVDELADDSDDEKRTEKAEKAAERKAGLRKRKRAKQQQPKFPVSLDGRGEIYIISVFPLHLCSGSHSRPFQLQLVLVGDVHPQQLHVQWAHVLHVARWDISGPTAPRYRHKRGSGILAVCTSVQRLM